MYTWTHGRRRKTMQTNYIQKPLKKRYDQTIKKTLALLKKGNFSQAAALPPENFEELRNELKHPEDREATLKFLENISLFVDKARQSLELDNHNDWAEEMRKESLDNLECLVQKGSLINSSEFLNQLSMTRQALCKARKSGRIFSVEIKGETYYPAFFTDPKYDRRQLEAVSKILGDLPGTSKLQFMLTPKGSLNSLTPLEALAKGRVAAVKISAEGFVER